MKIAICDDDAGDISSLVELIKSYPSADNEIYTYDSAVDLLNDYAKSVRYDLIFLDIQMDEIDGYSAAERLFNQYRDELPLIVFVTVSNKYVFAGYDVRAFGYFSKPVTKEQLFKKLDKARDELASRAITIHVNSENVLIPVKEIMFIEADNNKLTIISDSGKYPVRMTMAEMMEMLPKNMFCYSHRSYIVNLTRVRRYDDLYVYFGDKDIVKACLSRQQRVLFIKSLKDWVLRR